MLPIAAAAVVAAAAVLWLYLGSTLVTVREVRVHLPGLAPADDGLRVAVLSDPHFAPGDNGRAAGLAEKLNRLKPDLIVLLGDFVNGSPDRSESFSPAELTRFVSALRARCGVFAVTGNHEMWYGREAVVRALREGGATVLRDGSVTAATPSGRPLQIVGLSDFSTEEPDAFPALAPGIPTLVLMHDPRSALYVPEKLPCFCLAGHTHGGQLRLIPGGSDRTSLRLMVVRLKNKLGMLSIVQRPYALFDRGFTDFHGRRMFITSGVGGYPMRLRLFCPPELVLLRLGAAEDPAGAPAYHIPEEL